jgi:hypothetical protein
VEEVRSLFGDVDRFLGMCGAIALGMWEGDRFLGNVRGDRFWDMGNAIVFL